MAPPSSSKMVAAASSKTSAALEQELARARAMATAGELESLGIPADGAPADCIVALEKFDLPQTLFRLLKRSIRPT
jgi:hypothetical protein